MTWSTATTWPRRPPDLLTPIRTPVGGVLGGVLVVQRPQSLDGDRRPVRQPVRRRHRRTAAVTDVQAAGWGNEARARAVGFWAREGIGRLRHRGHASSLPGRRTGGAANSRRGDALLLIGVPASPVAAACPISLTASQRQRLKKAAFGHKTPHQARIRAQVVLHADAGHANARTVRNGCSGSSTTVPPIAAREPPRLAAAFPNAALVHPLSTLHG